MANLVSTALRYILSGWGFYFTLVVFRFFSVFHMQPGYLHPDEFFQGVEVAAGDIYNIQVLRTWEFSPDGGGPLRSVAGLAPVIFLPIAIYKHVLDGTDQGGSTKNFTGRDWLNRILLPTRFTAALGSMVVDLFILFATAHTNRYRVRVPPTALLLYASTAFGGFLWAGRTIANAWETSAVAAFGLLFIFVTRRLSSVSLGCRDVLLIATAMSVQSVLSTWAIFLRPTYVLFIAPMAFVEIYQFLYYLKRSVAVVLSTLLVLLTACVAQMCMIIDSSYFLGTTSIWSAAASLPLKDLVCVPCRFFLYNSNPDQVASHGLHPRYFHLLINLPLLLGPALPNLALFNPQSIRSGHRVWWFSCLVPLFCLSLIPHQEARFLMPIVPFVLILAGQTLDCWSAKSWKAKLRTFIITCWSVHQIVLVLLFGYFHQAGLATFYSSLPARSQACENYVFYHTYMPPRFPLGLPSTSSSDLCNTVVDLHGANSSELQHVLRNYQRMANSENQDVILNVLYPGSIAPLDFDLSSFGRILSYKLFFGHISFEDPPRFRANGREPETVSDYTYWYSQLSLHAVVLSTGK